MRPSFINSSLLTVLLTVSATMSVAQLKPGHSHPAPMPVNVQPAWGQRMAQIQLSQTLKHGETIQVRKVLNDLNKGDYVETLEVDARALQPGAYLEIIMDSTVISTLQISKPVRTVSAVIGKRNGIDYTRLIVRSIGQSQVEVVRAIITDDSNTQPLPPLPPPPGNGGGLQPGPGHGHPGNPGHGGGHQPNPQPNPPLYPPGSQPGPALNLREVLVGDTVALRNGIKGEVRGRFMDGSYSVYANYSLYTVSGMDVARKGCHLNVCSDESATTSTGIMGTVNGIFPNGDISIYSNYTNTVLKINQVAGKGCISNVCSDSEAYTRNGIAGTVKGVILNADAATVYANYTISTVRISDIAVPGCRYNLCSGRQVTTRNGISGVVKGHFDNSDVVVYSNYTYQVVRLQDISW